MSDCIGFYTLETIRPLDTPVEGTKMAGLGLHLVPMNSEVSERKGRCVLNGEYPQK